MVELIENDNSNRMQYSQLPDQAVALILAGGRGSRLRDLTADCAKPAVHFGGKYRLIDFALSNCVNSGIRRIGVITQYQSHSLVQHIQRGWSSSPYRKQTDAFIDVLADKPRNSKDNAYRGTADAVRQNLNSIRRYHARYVLILAGDQIYKMDYSRLLLDHVQNGASCTIACLPVPVAEAGAFGVITVNKNNRVVNFIEKPTYPPPMAGDASQALISMGIYAFNADYLCHLLENDLADEKLGHDFGKDLLPKIVAEGDVHAHSFMLSCLAAGADAKPYWRDVGTLHAYWRANLDLAAVKPALGGVDLRWPIRTQTDLLPPTKFLQVASGDYGQTRHSLISNGCVIYGSSIVHSVLSERVRVESDCDIDSSVLLPDVVVGRACRLRRCIIDRACELPEGTVIGENPDQDRQRFYRTEKGIVLVTRSMLTSH